MVWYLCEFRQTHKRDILTHTAVISATPGFCHPDLNRQIISGFWNEIWLSGRDPGPNKSNLLYCISCYFRFFLMLFKKTNIFCCTEFFSVLQRSMLNAHVAHLHTLIPPVQPSSCFHLNKWLWFNWTAEQRSQSRKWLARQCLLKPCAAVYLIVPVILRLCSIYFVA